MSTCWFHVWLLVLATLVIEVYSETCTYQRNPGYISKEAVTSKGDYNIDECEALCTLEPTCVAIELIRNPTGTEYCSFSVSTIMRARTYTFSVKSCSPDTMTDSVTSTVEPSTTEETCTYQRNAGYSAAEGTSFKGEYDIDECEALCTLDPTCVAIDHQHYSNDYCYFSGSTKMEARTTYTFSRKWCSPDTTTDSVTSTVKPITAVKSCSPDATTDSVTSTVEPTTAVPPVCKPDQVYVSYNKTVQALNDNIYCFNKENTSLDAANICQHSTGMLQYLTTNKPAYIEVVNNANTTCITLNTLVLTDSEICLAFTAQVNSDTRIEKSVNPAAICIVFNSDGPAITPGQSKAFNVGLETLNVDIDLEMNSLDGISGLQISGTTNQQTTTTSPPVQSTGVITGHVTCDDDMSFFVDGELKVMSTSWSQASSVAFPDTARSVAIQCLDHVDIGGIKAAFDNNVRTDRSWKCSNTFEDGWAEWNFDDSSWENATITTNPAWGELPAELNDGVTKWIWTKGGIHDRKVYCRKRFNTESTLPKHTLLTVRTADEFQYTPLLKYGVDIRGTTSLTFKVTACNDAILVFSETEAFPKNMAEKENFKYCELVIGGWSNTKSAFRRLQKEVTATNGERLFCKKQKMFKIDWSDNIFKVTDVGNNNEVIIKYTPLNFKINYVAITTGFKATGIWQFDTKRNGLVVDTQSTEYIYVPLFNLGVDIRGRTSLKFDVTACNDAHIGFSKLIDVFPKSSDTESQRKNLDVYEIVLGGWSNTKSALRHFSTSKEIFFNEGPIMDCNKPKTVEFDWSGNKLKVSVSGKMILEHSPFNFQMNYMAVSTGWNASGVWYFDVFDVIVKSVDPPILSVTVTPSSDITPEVIVMFNVTDDGNPQKTSTGNLTLLFDKIECENLATIIIDPETTQVNETVGKINCSALNGNVTYVEGDTYLVMVNEFGNILYQSGISKGGLRVEKSVVVASTSGVSVNFSVIVEIPILTGVMISFKVTNRDWSDSMVNNQSADYLQLKSEVEENFMSRLSGDKAIQGIKITNMRPGSVVIDAVMYVNENNTVLGNVTSFRDAIYTGNLGNLTVDPGSGVVFNGDQYISSPSLNLITGSPDSLLEGTVVKYVCGFRLVSVSGVVKPVVQWFLDDYQLVLTHTPRIKMSNTTRPTDKFGYVYNLEFDKAIPSHSGNLICKISSSKNTSVTESASTPVRIISKPVVTLWPLSSFVKGGESQKLTCTSKLASSLTVNYSWFDANTNIQIPQAISAEYTVAIIDKDLRLYCKVSNAAGTSQSQVAVAHHVPSAGHELSCASSVDTRNTSWPEGKTGTAVNLECGDGYVGYAQRFCNESGQWKTPDYSNCQKTNLVILKRETDDVKDGKLVKTPEQALETLVNLTQEGDRFSAGDVELAVQILMDVVDINNDDVDKVIMKDELQNFASSASNVLKADDEEWITLADQGKSGIAVMIDTIDAMAKLTSTRLNNTVPVTAVTDKMVIEVGRSKVSDIKFPRAGVSYPSWIANANNKILLQKSALQKFFTDDKEFGYNVVYYNEITNIVDGIILNSGQTTSINTGVDINSKILAFSVNPPPDKLDPEIYLTFQHTSENYSNPQCVFLDLQPPFDKIGRWSTEGCTTVLTSDPNITICRCNHLTNFAILMSPGKVLAGELWCASSVDTRTTTWPDGKTGTAVNLECGDGYVGYAQRFCTESGKWKTPDYSNCKRGSLLMLKRETDDVKGGILLSSPEQALKTLVNLTQDGSQLTAGDVELSVNILMDVVAILNDDINKVIMKDELQNFASSASNLLNAHDEEWTTLADQGKSGLAVMIDTIDAMAKLASARLNNTMPVTAITDQMVIEVGRSNVNDIKFPRAGGSYPSWIANANNEILLQKGALQKFFTDDEEFGYNVVYYNEISNIVNGNILNPDQTIGGNKTALDINTKILAFSVNPPPDKLDPEIFLTFQHTSDNYSNPQCVFLDLQPPFDKIGRWSTEGCTTESTSDPNITICKCNHLTNFCILMSPGKTPLEHIEALTYISIIGCGISLLCLVLTIGVYSYLWKYVKSDKSVILLNLCVSLIISYALFLGGVKQVQIKAVCQTIAALLHFFYLVVFCLMLAEGVQVFISVVYVFATKSRLKWILLASWGIPAIIVGTSLGVTRLEGYGNDDFCWLSLDSGLLWAFVGPALCVIFINLIIMIKVLRVMFRTHTMVTKTVKQKGKTGLKAIFVLLPIMGLTWVFGVFSVNEETVIFEYLFAIFNSLQGLLIFIFHCLMCSQVQDGFRMKRRRYRAKSIDTGTKSLTNMPLNMAEPLNTSPASSTSETETEKPTNDLDKSNSPFLQADRQVQEIAQKLAIDNNNIKNNANKVNIPPKSDFTLLDDIQESKKQPDLYAVRSRKRSDSRQNEIKRDEELSSHPYSPASIPSGAQLAKKSRSSDQPEYTKLNNRFNDGFNKGDNHVNYGFTKGNNRDDFTKGNNRDDFTKGDNRDDFIKGDNRNDFTRGNNHFSDSLTREDNRVNYGFTRGDNRVNYGFTRGDNRVNYGFTRGDNHDGFSKEDNRVNNGFTKENNRDDFTRGDNLNDFTRRDNRDDFTRGNNRCNDGFTREDNHDVFTRDDGFTKSPPRRPEVTKSPVAPKTKSKHYPPTDKWAQMKESKMKKPPQYRDVPAASRRIQSHEVSRPAPE